MNSLNKFLITLLTIEIVFGGGGRILEPLGIPPLRYILFAMAVCTFLLNLLTFRAKTTQESVLLFLGFIALPMYGLLLGAAKGNNISAILFDLQPFVYMLIIPYVCFTDKYLRDYSAKLFVNTVQTFAIIASTLYIIYVFLLRTGFIDFYSFYHTLSLTNEFFFRPSGAFFAKSFFFIGIGAIFFFCEKSYKLFTLSMVALFLTETRGVFLFTGVAVMLASFKINGSVKNLLLILLAIISGLGMMIIVGDRAGDSDSVRLNDFTFILDNMDNLSLFLGQGFGSEIAGRGRIEVVPLELLYKTGIVGILLSIIPVIRIISMYMQSSASSHQLKIGCALIFAAGVSITNPFLFTPMGIFLIAIAINSRVNKTPPPFLEV